MNVQIPRLDAQENLYFQRQLEQIAAKSYDVKYAELKAAQLVPVNTSVDPGAASLVMFSYDAVGVAKLVTAYGDDLPRVDVSATESVVRMKSYGASFGWNIDEIKASAMAASKGMVVGLPMEQRKQNMARRACDEKLDAIAATGDSETGSLGLANQTNASLYTIPVGASTFADWARKTADEILNDMHGICNAIVSNTLEVEKPDTLLLPTAQYLLISTKRADTLNSRTVLEVFLQNNPFIKQVISWTRLAGAGAGPTDRMVAYRRDPDAVELMLPIPFEQLPPEPRNLEVKVNCRNKTGGVFAHYPLSIAYGDGI